MAKMIRYENLTKKPVTLFGRTTTFPPSQNQHADVMPGVSIRLHGLMDLTSGPKPYDLTFRMGDVAEYHSYNLSYTGKIVSIGAKRIMIRDEMGRHHSLEIHEFSWRNRDFDLAETQTRNTNAMQYL
jgi:hypothetical protein